MTDKRGIFSQYPFEERMPHIILALNSADNALRAEALDTLSDALLFAATNGYVTIVFDSTADHAHKRSIDTLFALAPTASLFVLQLQFPHARELLIDPDGLCVKLNDLERFRAILRPCISTYIALDPEKTHCYVQEWTVSAAVRFLAPSDTMRTAALIWRCHVMLFHGKDIAENIQSLRKLGCSEAEIRFLAKKLLKRYLVYSPSSISKYGFLREFFTAISLTDDIKRILRTEYLPPIFHLLREGFCGRIHHLSFFKEIGVWDYENEDDREMLFYALRVIFSKKNYAAAKDILEELAMAIGTPFVRRTGFAQQLDRFGSEKSLLGRIIAMIEFKLMLRALPDDLRQRLCVC